MARIRSIKPEFFQSLSVADLGVYARLTFIGLWTHVDDDGRCVDDARLLKAALWPLDVDITTDAVEDFIDELEDRKKVVRYTVDGRRYLEVQGWHHQKIDRKKESKLPGPDQQDRHVAEPSAIDRRHDNEPSSPDLDRDQGSGSGPGSFAAGLAVIDTTSIDEQRSPAGDKRDLLFEAVADACGIDLRSLTDTSRGPLNKATSELRKIGVTPTAIPGRAAAYHRVYPDTALTPMALVKHWPSLDPSLASAPRTNTATGRSMSAIEAARQR